MGIFGLFKKQSSSAAAANTALPDSPYKETSTNLIYNLLFCDYPALYQQHTQQPYTYPFDILFSDEGSVGELQKLYADVTADTRVRILACNRLRAMGQAMEKKKLLAVIVEVGLPGGLDVLASFQNGTARYINQTGKILVWETVTDEGSGALTADLFSKSQVIIDQLGPWDQPRLPHPGKGNSRISFLVSDGLYFGEGPTDLLFADPMAAPALTSAAMLMKYLTEKAMAS